MPPVLRGFRGLRPTIGREVFLAETCALIGDVSVGDNSSIWYATALRGDVMPIRIGQRTSIQDGTIMHTTTDRFAAVVGHDCTIGHGVILHGCTVEDGCLIGMGATILDGARIGAGSFVGAGALVTPGSDIAPGSFVLGTPARVIRPVSQKERDAIAYGAAHYVELGREYLAADIDSSVR